MPDGSFLKGGNRYREGETAAERMKKVTTGSAGSRPETGYAGTAGKKTEAEVFA